MRIWVICLLWISLATSAVAQYFNPVYQQGQVTVKSNRVELRGKSLKLDFSVEFKNLEIGRYETLTLIPLLRGEKDSLLLSPIVINGANKAKMYRRSLALKGKAEADEGAYAVVENDPNYARSIPYRKTIPYRNWMKRAKLVLVGELCNYYGMPQRLFIDVLTDQLDIEVKPVKAEPAEEDSAR